MHAEGASRRIVEYRLRCWQFYEVRERTDTDDFTVREVGKKIDSNVIDESKREREIDADCWIG